MKKIVLASASERRKDILTKLGIDFEVISSTYEEVLENLDFDYEKIEHLAFCKASEVASRLNRSSIEVPTLIIGADTVVVFDGQIFGKPKDEIEAVSMLKTFSGKVHSVVTSICVINSQTNQHKLLSTTSFVEFENLSDELINFYVQNFKPFDKAGSYGIQELPDGFVKNVDGSLENIIGLCSSSLTEVLNSFN